MSRLFQFLSGVSLIAASLAVAAPTVYPTGTTLYEPGKNRLETWREGIAPDLAQHKTNELTLPEGRRP
jgi:hypothetical protein